LSPMYPPVDSAVVHFYFWKKLLKNIEDVDG